MDSELKSEEEDFVPQFRMDKGHARSAVFFFFERQLMFCARIVYNIELRHLGDPVIETLNSCRASKVVGSTPSYRNMSSCRIYEKR